MNDGMRPISTNTGLAAQAIELAYGDTPVLADMSIDVAPNRFTVLLGPNGSGKSTLLSALARLHRPARGHILLNGSDIFRHPTKEVAKKLGMLAQQNHTPEGLSVFDLVSRGRYPHQGFLKQWSEEDARAVEEALSVTGMSELAERAVDSLSGGQRQRAWIAMALAQQTDIILLDEPTTFLDLHHQIEVLDMLAGLVSRHNRTIVAVLHDINLALQYADHLIFLKDGQLRHRLETAAACDAGIIADVFDMAVAQLTHPVTARPVFLPLPGRAGAA
ncbi:putative siderophore transport system ATP-binding protein YusV [Agrobacterium deltaense NCPPB 1641]|uniref:Siderophore transport system ATP-binding protein YusV n=2 Tax=Rhizobium/Agrobacterium group TaxID=227290 RepID=A0A1S7TSG8_9HYPH|nr:putative siderophore transport system ATP-binding protein YusV [Agrobacterium deltaense NCPPB 1641]